MNTFARAKYLAELMPRIGRSTWARLAHMHCHLATDLTPGQMMLLGYLHQRGLATMRDLAQLGHVTMSTMTEMVDRLVKMRLVTRSHDSQDRRVVRIQITPQGWRRYQKEFEYACANFKHLLTTLNESQQNKIIASFKTIEEVLMSPPRQMKIEPRRKAS